MGKSQLEESSWIRVLALDHGITGPAEVKINPVVLVLSAESTISSEMFMQTPEEGNLGVCGSLCVCTCVFMYVIV